LRRRLTKETVINNVRIAAVANHGQLLSASTVRNPVTSCAPAMFAHAKPAVMTKRLAAGLKVMSQLRGQLPGKLAGKSLIRGLDRGILVGIQRMSAPYSGMLPPSVRNRA